MDKKILEFYASSNDINLEDLYQNAKTIASSLVMSLADYYNALDRLVVQLNNVNVADATPQPFHKKIIKK